MIEILLAWIFLSLRLLLLVDSYDFFFLPFFRPLDLMFSLVESDLFGDLIDDLFGDPLL